MAYTNIPPMAVTPKPSTTLGSLCYTYLKHHVQMLLVVWLPPLLIGMFLKPQIRGLMLVAAAVVVAHMRQGPIDNESRVGTVQGN
jgi:hypothetical protein